MNIPQEKLDFWRRACERLGRVLDEAQSSRKAGNSEAATDLIGFAGVALLLMGNEMEAEGAERPRGVKAPAEVPLDMLSSGANCRLAEKLRRALEASAAVDKERGAAESGHGHVLRMLLAEVETEVFGAEGLKADA